MDKYRIPNNKLGFHCLCICEDGNVLRLVRIGEEIRNSFSVDLTDSSVYIPMHHRIKLPDKELWRNNWFKSASPPPPKLNGFKIPKNSTNYTAMIVTPELICVHHIGGFVCTIWGRKESIGYDIRVDVGEESGILYGSIEWSDEQKHSADGSFNASITITKP